MTLLRAYLESLPPGFVPSDLLSGVDTRANPAGARLLVTAVALERPTSAVWTTAAVTRSGPITVLSVLLELKALGVLERVEQVQGGFRVFEGSNLRKEDSA